MLRLRAQAICSRGDLDQLHFIFGQRLSAFTKHFFMQAYRLTNIFQSLVARSSLADTTWKTGHFRNNEAIVARIQ